MDIWLVPSHHSICMHPQDKLGIKLTPTHLGYDTTVWMPYPGGASFSNEEEVSFNRKYLRSKNEAGYIAALKALHQLDIHGAIAVVSLKMIDRVYPLRLVTTHRVWLAVYRYGGVMFSLPRSFAGQGKCYSFLETRDGDDWARHFSELLEVPSILEPLH